MEHDATLTNIEDHLERCRLCLAYITENDVFYQLNETIKLRYENLTSQELEIENSNFSCLVCASCYRNLVKFAALREDFIYKQSQLRRFVRYKDDDRHEGEIEMLEDEMFLSETEATLEAEENEVYFENTIISPKNEDDEVEMTIEFIVSENEDSLSINEESDRFLMKETDNSKKILRPKAWNWTHEMEIDLIRYIMKYKSEKTSDRSVFEKISKKFETKDYPKISGKSIKYKYEKLLSDPEKLTELQLQASSNPVESEDDTNVEVEQQTKRFRKRETIKKNYCMWNEEMEVMLLYLSMKMKQEQPAIPDNTLHRELAKEMKSEGYNVTQNIINYHFKKLRQDKMHHLMLMAKAKELKKQRDETRGYQSSDFWSQQGESSPLNYKEKIENESSNFDLKSSESKLSEDDEKSSAKRRYLFWTEEMKIALTSHRNDLEKQTSPGELWSSVAKRMKADGFGTFTAHNVKNKYFNLKRPKVKPSYH